MINIKDIARILATRHSISNADADTFVQMIVEVINEGLFQDRQVKIKGFGTFKLQMVKERTSVNVNTGEKVVIGEHDKVSFTPDNVMKDLINKPFAHFDTVPVDDDSPLLEGKDISELNLELDDEYADNTAERNEALSEMFVDYILIQNTHLIVGLVFGQFFQCDLNGYQSCHVKIYGIDNTVICHTAFHIIKLLCQIQPGAISCDKLQPFFIVCLEHFAFVILENSLSF